MDPGLKIKQSYLMLNNHKNKFDSHWHSQSHSYEINVNGCDNPEITLTGVGPKKARADSNAQLNFFIRFDIKQ
jgi:general stress protein 26